MTRDKWREMCAATKQYIKRKRYVHISKKFEIVDKRIIWSPGWTYRKVDRAS